MTRALERHAAGSCVVIPVILRACDWKATPLGALLAAPKDGKPITQWPDKDEAFLDVVQSVRTALKKVRGTAAAPRKRGTIVNHEKSLSRRSLIQKLTIAPLAIGAFAALQAEAEAEAKAPQITVFYRKKPHGNKACAGCEYFLVNKQRQTAAASA